MNNNTNAHEIRRLSEVANEYRQNGYDVLVEPRPDQLPSFLAPFRIDMLAQNAEENVVIEVRTQASLTAAPELDAIAQALHDRPSWRFDLVVTNPQDRSALQFKDATSLDALDIGYRLDEARQLSEQEHGEAAFLLAWSATEALLRHVADTEAIPVLAQQPNHVIKSLFTYGVLDKEQYDVLQYGLQARTMLVHGYKEQKPLADIVERVLRVAEQLRQHM